MIKNKFDLTGKIALVVGGRGFLGRHFCLALKDHGANVYSADLSKTSRAASRDTHQPSGDNIKQHFVDVTDPKSVANMVDSIIKEATRIDILIYSVTVKPTDFYSPFTECSLEGWQQVFHVEMDGLFLTTQNVGRAMEAQKNGNIIFLSSIYGIVGNDQRIYEGANLSQVYGSNRNDRDKRTYSHAAYSAVKGGIISLTRFLAAYWEGKNIRVNCISAGGVYHPGENETFVEQYSARVPLGRKADIDEISGAVVYLASDASTYVNGHNLVVDGGWTAW